MIKKSIICLAVIMLLTIEVRAQGLQKVEVFDIEQNRVIKTVSPHPVIQKEGETYIRHITDIYRKFRVIPDKGYMIKIPLEPPVTIENQWMNGLVNEVIIIAGEKEKPYLMVFDDENHPHFFSFQGSTNILFSTLQLPATQP